MQGKIHLGEEQHNGWQDLVFNVSGGGVTPAQHVLQYSGVSYPLNPSVAPKITSDKVSQVTLFADEISPMQKGVKL